jgi:hypothetical protein
VDGVAVSKIEAYAVFLELCHSKERISCFAGRSYYYFSMKEFDGIRVCLEARGIPKADNAVFAAGRTLDFQCLMSNQILSWSAVAVEYDADACLLKTKLAGSVYRDSKTPLFEFKPPPADMVIILRSTDGTALHAEAAHIDLPTALIAMDEGGEVSALAVELAKEGRTVRCKAIVERSFEDGGKHYALCRFFGVKMEDLRFLIEDVYGRSFQDSDLEMAEL